MFLPSIKKRLKAKQEQKTFNIGHFLFIVLILSCSLIFVFNIAINYTGNGNIKKLLNSFITKYLSLNENILIHLFSSTLAFLIGLVVSFQCIRTLNGILILIFVMIWVIKRSLSILKWLQFTKKDKMRNIISLYRKFTLILKNAEKAATSGVFCLMILGFLLCVFCNFVTIKLYGIVPIYFYIIFVTMSILAPVVISMTLPIAVYLHEFTKHLLFKWCNTVETKKCTRRFTKFNKKIILRDIKSLKPLTIYPGLGSYRLFAITKTIVISYYMAILDTTIDAILAF